MLSTTELPHGNHHFLFFLQRKAKKAHKSKKERNSGMERPISKDISGFL